MAGRAALRIRPSLDRVGHPEIRPMHGGFEGILLLVALRAGGLGMAARARHRVASGLGTVPQAPVLEMVLGHEPPSVRVTESALIGAGDRDFPEVALMTGFRARSDASARNPGFERIRASWLLSEIMAIRAGDSQILERLAMRGMREEPLHRRDEIHSARFGGKARGSERDRPHDAERNQPEGLSENT